MGTMQDCLLYLALDLNSHDYNLLNKWVTNRMGNFQFPKINFTDLKGEYGQCTGSSSSSNTNTNTIAIATATATPTASANAAAAAVAVAVVTTATAVAVKVAAILRTALAYKMPATSTATTCDL
ncbi:unnamed protein product [Cercopithifilaria johnstoni]|uniref:Uncharacterized protein n=2 Tax=Cercopithifilaria johnstoni TaxID=2874296 RepID=A0A8J2M3G4_9BILA|nr:unnamed protein product [Cercopithifilaria johnstoni]